MGDTRTFSSTALEQFATLYFTSPLIRFVLCRTYSLHSANFTYLFGNFCLISYWWWATNKVDSWRNGTKEVHEHTHTHTHARPLFFQFRDTFQCHQVPNASILLHSPHHIPPHTCIHICLLKHRSSKSSVTLTD